MKVIELHLNEYSYEEFVEIARRLLKKGYGIDTDCPDKIVYSVWHRMQSKDIRYVVNFAKLTKSSADIDWLINIQLK